MKRVLALVVTAAVGLTATEARADDAAIAAGRARFTKGVTLFREGAFAAALVEFNGAYAAAPSFRIQFNIAQTCAELHDYACAVNAFDRFLADGGAQVPPAQRAVAEKEKKRLKAFVSSVYITVNVEGAEVSMDDVKVGTSPLTVPVLASAGRRTFTATKPPMLPARSVLDVPGGEDRVETRLELVAPTPTTPAKPAGEVRPEPHTERPSRLPVWIGVGATGALAAATAVFGVLTLSAKSDLHDGTDRFGLTRAELDSAQSKQDTLAVVTDVTLGVAIVAAGVTAALYIMRR